MSKKKKKADASLFYADGCILEEDQFLCFGQFSSHPQAPVSRYIFRLNEQWLCKDSMSDMLRSVTYSNFLGKAYCLGPSGVIISMGAKGKPFSRENLAATITTTNIEDPQCSIADLFCIRSIGENLYVCGFGGQIYKGDGAQWQAIDLGPLGGIDCDLLSIDGYTEDCIYAVGLGGLALKYEGESWKHLALPTKSNLYKVLAVGPRHSFAVGSNGCILQEKDGIWQSIPSEEIGEENIWDITWYRDQLWLCSSQGLFIYDSKRIQKVDLPFSIRKPSFYKLHSKGNQLLSIGVNMLLIYDGKSWRELTWLDNKKWTDLIDY